MIIVDAQHHEITPQLEWNTEDTGVQHRVMTEVLLAWMDAVGVDAALINPLDNAWAQAAVADRPDRFASFVAVMMPENVDVDETVARLHDEAGVVAVRTGFGNTREDPKGETSVARLKGGVFDGLFAACANHDLPLFCGAYGHADLIAIAAERYPELQLVIDHMGIPQRPILEPDSPPWRALDDVVELARYPNVFVKVTAVPVLSDQSYPYRDVWPHLQRLIDAYGADRLMWASDIGRIQGRIGWKTAFPEGLTDYPGKHNYAQSLFAILDSDEISRSEKEQILGGAVQRLLGWPNRSAA